MAWAKAAGHIEREVNPGSGSGSWSGNGAGAGSGSGSNSGSGAGSGSGYNSGAGYNSGSNSESNPGAALASAPGTNATELITILARIQWLLSEFRDLNARYGNELVPEDVVAKKDGKGGKDGKKEGRDVKGIGKEGSKDSTATGSKEKSTPAEQRPATDHLLSQISSLALSYDLAQQSQKTKDIPPDPSSP